MSVARALRLAAEKTADEDMQMALSVAAVQRSERDQAALLGLIPVDMLMLLLDGPLGARGAVMLDAGIMTSLIEVQTTGQVQARAASVRKATRIDAAMAVPLVDGVLRRAAGYLADHPDGAWASGFRFGAMMEDVRGLGLALAAADFHVFRLTLDIGPGMRTGELILALPCPTASPDPSDAADKAATQQFQDRVLAAPVRLDAVLCRLSLPLSQLSLIKTGDLLPLNIDALRDIMVETVGHRPVATARLGRLDGFRALRLTLPGQGRAVQGDAVVGTSTPETGRQETTTSTATAPKSAPEPVAGAIGAEQAGRAEQDARDQTLLADER